MSEFLPKDYKVPSSGGNYTKFEEGTTTLRILSAPLLGWVDWKEVEGKKTPLRFAFDNKPEPFNKEKPVRHFWAFKVWNYKTKSIQIWEITQSGIQGKIQSLVTNENWGIPIEYDLDIIREGMGFSDTKYDVQPVPPKALAEDIVAKDKAIKVDLNKLLADLDPFDFEATSKKEAQTEDTTDYSEEDIV